MALDLEKLEQQVNDALASISDDDLKKWMQEKKEKEFKEEYLGGEEIKLLTGFSSVFCKGST